MSRTSKRFKRQDVVANFLPSVRIRRVTLGTPTAVVDPRGPSIDFDEDRMSLTIDLEIEDILEDAKAKSARGSLLRSDEKLTKEVKKGIDRDFDEALKVCVLIGTTSAADQVLRRVLSRSSNRENFQERVGIQIGNKNNASSITINQGLRALTESTEGVIYFSDAARPVNGAQNLDNSIEMLKTFDSKNTPIYRLPVSFSTSEIPANTEHLCVYTFTFIDFGAFDIEIPAEEISWLNNLYGLLSYNKVIEGGEVSSYSMVLLDSDGYAYTGPYHRMRNGQYMKGYYHKERVVDSDYLTSTMVPNTKIQDFRTFKRAEKDLYIPQGLPSFLQQDFKTKMLKHKRDNNFNSRLEIERDPDRGSVEFEFIIDQEQILRQNSKFGALYDKLPNRAKYNVLRPRDYFRLVSVKILRRRMTNRDIGINSLGMPAKDVFDSNETPFVVVESSERHRQNAHPRSELGFSPFLLRSGADQSVFNEEDLIITQKGLRASVSDEPYSELSISTNSQNFVDWLSSESLSPVPLDNLKTLPFPFYRNIIGADMSLMNVHEGIYQYGIELTYEDGIEKYLTEIMENLQLETRKLEEYYNECLIPVTSPKYSARSGLTGPSAEESNPDFKSLRKEKLESQGNYNHLKKAFAPDFVAYANRKYNFQKMVSAYFEVVNVVFSDAQLRVGNVSNLDENSESKFDFDTVMSLLMPNNSRPEQVLELLSSFQEMAGLLSDIVDYDLTRGTTNISLEKGDRASSGRAPTLINVQKWYSGVDDFVDARMGGEPVLDFFGDNMKPFTITSDPAPVSIEQNPLSSKAMSRSSTTETSPTFSGKQLSENEDTMRIHGQKNFTPSQVSDRVATEMSKFDTDFGDTKYDETPASLTFMNFKIPGPKPIKISFQPEEKEVFGSPKVDEDLIIRYRTQKSRRTRRRIKDSAPREYRQTFQVTDMVLSRSKISKNKSLGTIKPIVLKDVSPKYSSKTPNVRILDKLKTALETELVLEDGATSIIINEPKKDNKITIDSVKILCDDFSVEPNLSIELVEDLSEEKTPESEPSPKGLAISRTIETKARNKNIAPEMPTKISVSKVRETIELNPPEEVRRKAQNASRRSRRTRRPRERGKRRPPATAAGWAAGAAAARREREKIEIVQDPIRSEVKKKSLDPPMQVAKLAEEGQTLGATPSEAPVSLYGAVMKIQKLEGFKEDDDGRPILSAPVYRDVTVSEVKQGLPEGKYKLEPFESDDMGIKAVDVVKSKPIRMKVTKQDKPPTSPAKKPRQKSIIADAVKRAKKAERDRERETTISNKTSSSKLTEARNILNKEEQKQQEREVRQTRQQNKNSRTAATTAPRSRVSEEKAKAAKEIHRRQVEKRNAAKAANSERRTRRAAADRRNAQIIERNKNAKAKNSSNRNQSNGINIVRGSVTSAPNSTPMVTPMMPSSGGSGGSGTGGY